MRLGIIFVAIKAQSIELGITLAWPADTFLNLDSLLIQLQDKVTEKWHQFGIALGVEEEILDRCLKYPPEQSIVEMLDHWLRNYDCEERSWKEVARALRQIEHHQLAKEIKSIDKTGHDYDSDRINLCVKNAVIEEICYLNTESDDVPDDALQQSKSDPADESPSPKKCHDDNDNPEDFLHGDIIKYANKLLCTWP